MNSNANGDRSAGGNRCGWAQEVSLLAAGALSAGDKSEAETHLAECAKCQNYYAAIARISARMRGWENAHAEILATPEMRWKWASAVTDSKPTVERRNFLIALWNEIVLPCRYFWTGLAAMWIAALMIDQGLADGHARGASPSAQEMRAAWEEQNRVLAEFPVLAAKPNDSTIEREPHYVPHPSSQIEKSWFVI